MITFVMIPTKFLNWIRGKPERLNAVTLTSLSMSLTSFLFFAHLHWHTGPNIKSLAYLQLLSIAKVDLATKGAESVHGRTMRDELGSKLNIADNG